MKTKYIIRKQLSTLPCRFILGCIGSSREFSPEINQKLLHSIENKFGIIEEILPVKDFSNPPESYFGEMGNQPLATTMIILKKKGAYTDLHHLKKDAKKLEKQFFTSSNSRTFNINPGAVGTYGLCLVSHKPTGGRPDISTYAFGFHPHFFDFFGSGSYYERVARWMGNKLELIDYIKQENKFSEYTEANRIARFEELVRTLKKSNMSVELMADRWRVA